jgi:hypothetical protein
MRGFCAIALVTLLLAPAVWAQRGGGHAGGGHAGGSMGHSGFAAHPGFAAHGPATSGHGGMTWSSPATGGQFHSSFHGPSSFDHRGHHRRFGFNAFPWGYYYPYSYYYSYPYWDYGYADWSDSNPYSAPYQYSSDDYAQNNTQQAEIDRLEDEVERLREQREARTQPQPQAKSEPHEATVLVFNDKHTQQVDNYAIVGQTLWVFSELRATKIPLSSLDLEATAKANDERGVDFHVPN